MKQIIATILVLVMAAGLMAGCGSTPSSQASPSGHATDQASPSEQASPSVQPKENVVIKAYGLTAGFKDVEEKFVADYNSLNNGTTIEWEIPGDEPYTVLKTRFSSGEAPDIFDLGPGDLSAWGERCADLTGETFLNTLQQSAKDSVTVDGKVLGFPYAMEASGIIYNKDLFSKAGITEVPKTLDQLEDACKKLQAAGIQPFGEAWKEWGFLMHIFGTPFAYESNEQDVCAKISAGQMKLADLAYMDNFFRLFDMTLTYGKGAESIGYGVMDQLADFASGKMAMIKQGTWMTNYLYTTNPDLNLGLFAVPITNNPDDTKLMTTSTRYLVINKDSANLTEAKAFINWLYENTQKYFVDGLQLAAPYDGLDMSKLGPLNDDMFTYVKEGKAFSTFGSAYWPSGFNVDLATPLQAYAAGAADKETTLNELQKLWDSRVASK